MRRAVLALCLLSAKAIAAPVYAPDGGLLWPDGYHEWVFLGSGLDLSYGQASGGMQHSMFNTVFADPDSYRAFLRSGHWAEGTMLALELRGAGTAAPPLRAGKYPTTEMMGLEVHVRDRRFAGGWAFFAFDGKLGQVGKLVPAEAGCAACHEAHAAVDTTFVQFYPTLLPIAEKFGTLSAGYLRHVDDPPR